MTGKKSFNDYMQECDCVSYKIILSMIRDGLFDDKGPEVVQTLIDICATVAQHKYGKTYNDEVLIVAAGIQWDHLRRNPKKS